MQTWIRTSLECKGPLGICPRGLICTCTYVGTLLKCRHCRWRCKLEFELHLNAKAPWVYVRMGLYVHVHTLVLYWNVDTAVEGANLNSKCLGRQSPLGSHLAAPPIRTLVFDKETKKKKFEVSKPKTFWSPSRPLPETFGWIGCFGFFERRSLLIWPIFDQGNAQKSRLQGQNAY